MSDMYLYVFVNSYKAVFIAILNIVHAWYVPKNVLYT